MPLPVSQLENTCYRLGLSLKAGVPIAQAWEIESRLLRGRTRRVFDGVLGRIREGTTLADSMAGEKSFPPLLIEMVRVGEETGQLDQALLRLADHYRNLAAARSAAQLSEAIWGDQTRCGPGIRANFIVWWVALGACPGRLPPAGASPGA